MNIRASGEDETAQRLSDDHAADRGAGDDLLVFGNALMSAEAWLLLLGSMVGRWLPSPAGDLKAVAMITYFAAGIVVLFVGHIVGFPDWAERAATAVGGALIGVGSKILDANDTGYLKRDNEPAEELVQ